ncbi:MAG TPA: Gfo/Idh/MocA family oxidoreductase [Sedimentisphaerales bacterium]|nr:Gfo/Idh/MocA family oxidoreductase [Sedimentisphaerales bacterium]HRS09595.1 Gfo/Idh/MocA family oxidoreductase [Sedimentisphaerales bacterium]HRV46277.1 Gfo/Idh/MocA family oxidoreductase [Sedimentisphaerales bacterium]
MTEPTLTAGVLGLGSAGHLLLEAARRTGQFLIKAVADQDPQQAERTAAELQAEPYTDYRQMVVQNQLDCLLVAADTHLCDEHLKTAIRKKFHVLKLAPPARNYEETLEYVQMAEYEKVRFAIANPARFRSSYSTAHDLIVRGQVKGAFLVTAYSETPDADRPAWHADPRLAGGGVLLHDCHQIVDQILWNFSLPQQVYVLTTNQAPDKQQRLYLTEDTAVVSMKFTDALTASIVATRRSGQGPTRRGLQIYAKEARLTITDNRVILNTDSGLEDQVWQFEETELDTMQRLLSSFAQSVRNPAEHPLISSAAENLRNMAVFESAYLSARTGFPEEPLRILQITRNTPGATGLSGPNIAAYIRDTAL